MPYRLKIEQDLDVCHLNMALSRFSVICAHLGLSCGLLQVDWTSSESNVSSKFAVAEAGLLYLVDNRTLHALHRADGSRAFVDSTRADDVSEYGGVAYGT